MDELQILVKMVADLPQMALWVLIGFFVYKVIIIGSIFGIIRLGIVSLYKWAMTKKREPVVKLSKKFHTLAYEDDEIALLVQLDRIRDKSNSYVSTDDVARLTRILDDALVSTAYTKSFK